MTEVPDHLLRRSRERRDALGLGGGGEGAPPPPAAEPSEAGGADPAAAAVEAAPAAAAPAVPEPVELEPAAPLPQTRTGIPRWMMPVLVLLPFWAIIYVGAFGTTKKAGPPLTGAALGQAIYHGKGGCAGCHGPAGEGVSGPKLAGGEAVKTFPNLADHISWVNTGSSPFKGKPYGSPTREGGQHIATTGGMPAFKGTLSDAEIAAVVEYERTKL